MKRIALLLFLAAFPAISLFAGDARNVCLVRQGDSLVVKMDLDLNASYLRGNSVFVLRPVLRNGLDERPLKAVGLYTRNMFFHYLRNAPGGRVTGEGEISLRRRDLPTSVSYRDIIPYESWMEGARLVLERVSYGCCGHQVFLGATPLEVLEENLER